ncbi:RagB/SusD family nutrient uptake outer membrane protein [Parabacteroides sp. AF18-52]|uniref:RagB/SusD family nutrient uptake outer membrane protein n=1 Tax=Parabacteroides TaxID=375288 RepID=UPI000EFF991D|nr:RagB/SusD family nutrient uptake outer membrane protein [Parabacteroides sp. AF18-52]RHR37292.1 RagB/SusD family nutrient uptake outer membrane protein [Parabacteroides sp. AF18-52]
MKKNIIFIISIFMLFVSTGCSDSFLDRKPQDKISEEDVFNNDDLLTAYVNACYNSIPSGYDFIMLSSVTDETYCRHGGTTCLVISRGELNPDNVTNDDWGWFTGLNYWSKAYQYIRDINVFFEKINDAQITEEIKERLTGEMKFLRAYIYSNLIWRYGGVPIITRSYSLGEQDYSLGRNTYDECVEFILNELEEAIDILPDKMNGSNWGRASADVCKALRARVLLYWASPLVNTSNDITRWERARDANKEVMDLSGYSLSSNYKNIFLEATNEEIIFLRQFTKANGHNMMVNNSPNGYDGNGGNCPLQNLVDDYEMKATGLKPAETGSGFDPNDPYKGRDPRFYMTVLYNGAMYKGRAVETFTPGGKDSSEGNSGWNTSLTGYYMFKFLDENQLVSETNTMPLIFFRLSEFYLNYAEAQYHLGAEDECRRAINEIRGRTGVEMPPVTATGDKLLEKVYQERRIELALENHRYFDLRRWKLAEKYENINAMGCGITLNNGTYTYSPIKVLDRKFLPQHYWVPIPREEIVKSNYVLKQNPGYN